MGQIVGTQELCYTRVAVDYRRHRDSVHVSSQLVLNIVAATAAVVVTPSSRKAPPRDVRNNNVHATAIFPPSATRTIRIIFFFLRLIYLYCFHSRIKRDVKQQMTRSTI